MKGKILFILSVIFFVLAFSCGQTPGTSTSATSSSSSTASVPSSDLKLKNYVGAASIGDIIWYGIDTNNNTLNYSNITRGYSWSSSYTPQEDGTMKFTIPVINEEACFIEIPDKMLIVVFSIWDNVVHTNYPAFAVLVPQTIQSQDDMTNVGGAYFFLNAKRVSEGEYKGMYELEPNGVVVTPSNASVYQGTSNGLVNSGAAPIGFSDTMKTCFVVIPEGTTSNTNYFFANSSTFVLDRGLNTGFGFGAKVATNAPSLSSFEGRYVFVSLGQGRDSGQSNLTYSYVGKEIIVLSNKGTYLDVYLGTNMASLNKVDSMGLADFPSTDGKIPHCYGLTNFNYSDSPITVILGEDSSYSFLFSMEGRPDDINSPYMVFFGFIKKVE